MKENSTRAISILLIILGSITFTLIGSLAIWADFEASLFNSAMRSSESLSSLRCPSFISSDEVGLVSATFTNPSEKTIKPLIRTYISDGYIILMQERNERLSILPGEKETVEVNVTAENPVYNRLILVRMHQLAARPLPYRNASCGIFIIDIPFLTGNQFVIISLFLGSIFSAFGLILYKNYFNPNDDRVTSLNLMIALVLLSILVTITGLSSWWLPGILLIVLWFLLVIGIFGQFILSSKNNSLKKLRSK